MFHPILLCLLTGGTPPPTLLPSPGHLPTAQASLASVQDAEFDRRFKEAAGDAKKLWRLHTWCEDTGRDAESRRTLRAVIKADPDHLQARKALGHLRHGGRWYSSQKKVDEAIAKERDREAKAQGLVKYRGQWAEPADLPFLKRGLVRGPEGGWITQEDQKKFEKGWARQDLVWVSPEEMPKVDAGLWKCGEEWLELAAANRHHNRFERCWVIPGDNVELWTTCERKTAMVAMDHMERCYRDLVKVYGMAPPGRIRVALFRSADQMGYFCTEGGRDRPAAESRSLVDVLEATFMESWVIEEGTLWMGAGATYWDSMRKNGDAFGLHDARMAFGLSFSEAMDPSPKALAALAKKGYNADFPTRFYEEKTIPPWFAWGAAAYGSRYFEDSSVGSGGDSWWPRKWSVENLQRTGGAMFLGPVFDMKLKSSDRRCGTLINAAGLLVAFMVDGGCPDLVKVHEALKKALREGKSTAKIFNRLRKELEKHEDEMRAFAGL